MLVGRLGLGTLVVESLLIIVMRITLRQGPLDLSNVDAWQELEEEKE